MSSKIGGYMNVDTGDGVPPYVLTWSFNEEPSKKITKGSKLPKVPKVQKILSPAEEIWQLVQDYAKVHGLTISAEDEKVCLDDIEEEKRKAGEPIDTTPIKPAKPEYGSKEFWKAHWEKKKANGWVPKAKEAKEAKVKE